MSKVSSGDGGSNHFELAVREMERIGRSQGQVSADDFAKVCELGSLNLDEIGELAKRFIREGIEIQETTQ